MTVVTWLPRTMECAVPGISQAEALCDHEGVPRGTASRWKTRYSVRLTVPRRGGWRAWAIVRADFERALADPAITSAEVASELRRGADYVRVAVVLSVAADDVADALTIAWDAFRAAAASDLAGWEATAAVAEIQPSQPEADSLGQLHWRSPSSAACSSVPGPRRQLAARPWRSL
jgi:hypothetical protein